MQRLFGVTGSLALAALALLSPACIDDASAPGSADETGTADMLDMSDDFAFGADAMGQQACGGLLGLQCPTGKTCVDDPSDNCELGNGADCPGVCRGGNGSNNGNGKKGCNKGPGVTYVGDAETCTYIKYACEPGFQAFSDNCGCGCEPAAGEACGPNVCGDGLVCCNSSCGICTEPGGFCTQQACVPSAMVDDADLGNFAAADNSQTTAKPVAEFCGGIAGIQCPDGKVCVDDPKDGCDPANGGADCGGICKKAKGKPGDKCERGSEYTYISTDVDQCAVIHFICESNEAFFNDCGCGCVG